MSHNWELRKCGIESCLHLPSLPENLADAIRANRPRTSSCTRGPNSALRSLAVELGCSKRKIYCSGFKIYVNSCMQFYSFKINRLPASYRPSQQFKLTPLPIPVATRALKALSDSNATHLSNPQLASNLSEILRRSQIEPFRVVR